MAKRIYSFAPGWMDYAAVAHYTCYSERTIKEWFRKGLLPAARVEGGDPRFRREDVDALMEAHKRESLLRIAEGIIKEI